MGIFHTSSITLYAQQYRNLGGGGLENHRRLIGSLSEWNAQLEELCDDSSKILEEELLVLGVLINMLLEALVRDKSHIGGQHHESLGSLVLVLDIKVSLFPTFKNYEKLTCLGPFHFFQFHFSFNNSLKYSLVTTVGEKVHGPVKPLRSVWQRPKA